MSAAVLCLRPEADFTRAGAVAPAGLEVSYRAPTEADVAALLAGSQALVIPAVGPRLDVALFEGAQRLRLVQVTGAGVDRVDVPAMQRLGIAVCNVPGGSNAAVAEYAVGCAIVLLRRFAWADAEIKAGRYAAFRARLLADNVAGLDGLTVGLVGLGTIGLAVARAFARFGAQLCYHDPAPRDLSAAASLGARAVPFDELLASSDVVSLHVPLLPQTIGLIGAAQLARMKPTAVLIQAARGGVVDEAALAAALSAGRLGGAAIDVYPVEPPGADNPLFALRGEAAARVLFTPHVAGVTRQSAAYLFREAWRNVARVLLDGAAPLHRVD